MTYTSTFNVLTYALTLLSFIFILKFLVKPVKLIFGIFFKMLLGCGAIVLINTVSSYTGICIALNAVTATLCGIFGSGGIVFLVFYHLFL